MSIVMAGDQTFNTECRPVPETVHFTIMVQTMKKAKQKKPEGHSVPQADPVRDRGSGQGKVKV